MDEIILNIISIYATKKHSELNKLLLSKSKDELIAIINNIITIYMNDKNSSTLREYLTVSLAGYKPNDKKLGYNGFKQNTTIGGNIISCECKPKNISLDSKYKHNGCANFTDYTFKRFERDIKNNIKMLLSGFINGELLFIYEFPFNCSTFRNRLKQQLEKRFSKKQDILGEYLRSASFRLVDYKECTKLKIIYINKESIKKNKSKFTKMFYDFLLNL